MPESTEQRLLRLGPGERRELLRRLRERAAPAAPEPSPSEGRLLPASPMQASQWFLWNVDRGGNSYHILHLHELSGALDEAALHRALRGVLALHDGVRVHFLQREGRVWQSVRPVPDEVLETTTAPDRATAREELVRGHSRAFDLRDGPLYRFSLCRFGTGRYLLMLSFHHSVIDDQSAVVFHRDLSALYARESGGRGPVPVRGPQYQDVVRAWSERDGGLDHWVRTLAGSRPTTAPADRVPAPGQRLRLRLEVPLPDGDDAALRRLAASCGTTVYVVALALCWLFLARVSGDRDVTVGSPVSLREGSRDQDVVGFFLNSLALRGRIRPERSLRDLVGQAHRVFGEAMAHRRDALDDVTAAVARATGRHGQPLFRPLFAYIRGTKGEDGLLRLPGLVVTHDPVNTDGSSFELGVTVLDEGDRLYVLLDRAAEVYSQASAERWRAVWLRLAEAAREPDLPVGRLLYDDRPAPSGGAADHRGPVTDPVGANDPAVLGGGLAVTRGELERAVGVLAGRLARRGVGRGGAVAVELPAGPAAVAAVFAVWRLGATVTAPGPGVVRVLAEGGEGAAGADEVDGADGVVVSPELAAWRGEPAAPVGRVPDAACAWDACGDPGQRVSYGELRRYRALLNELRGEWTERLGRVPRAGVGAPVSSPLFVAQALGRAAGWIAVCGPGDGGAAGVDLVHCATDRLEAWAAVPDDVPLPALLLTAGRPPSARALERLRERGTEVRSLGPVAGVRGDPLGRRSGWLPVGPEGRAAPVGTPGELVVPAGPCATAGRTGELVLPARPRATADTTGTPGELVEPAGPRATAATPGRTGEQMLPARPRAAVATPGRAGDQAPPAETRAAAGTAGRTAALLVPDPSADVPGGRVLRTGLRGRTGPADVPDPLHWTDPRVPEEVRRVEAALRAGPGVAQVVAVPPVDGTGGPLTVFLVRERGARVTEGELRGALPARQSSRASVRLVALPRMPLTAAGDVDREALARLAGSARQNSTARQSASPNQKEAAPRV
ncbi:condensation domain-containing protein [Streptomyces sp. NPDC059783]|uniref:condensation domain-containing protein n=1 Tax=Streptomyces sp. NPDC059783 TaxID=3346944 RepID=UPI00365A331B